MFRKGCNIFSNVGLHLGNAQTVRIKINIFWGGNRVPSLSEPIVAPIWLKYIWCNIHLLSADGNSVGSANKENRGDELSCAMRRRSDRNETTSHQLDATTNVWSGACECASVPGTATIPAWWSAATTTPSKRLQRLRLATAASRRTRVPKRCRAHVRVFGGGGSGSCVKPMKMLGARVRWARGTDDASGRWVGGAGGTGSLAKCLVGENVTLATPWQFRLAYTTPAICFLNSFMSTEVLHGSKW